jgi:acylpyruvate hydrolase
VFHEVELGVILGRRCKDVPPEKVHQYIGGYCVALDLTAVNVLVNNSYLYIIIDHSYL